MKDIHILPVKNCGPEQNCAQDKGIAALEIQFDPSAYCGQNSKYNPDTKFPDTYSHQSA
jgi:hypothetical protein